MKKALLLVLVFVGFNSAMAQNWREDFRASMERAEKLGKLSAPKSTSIATVDNLNSEIGKAASESMEISPLLKNLYYRSIGQTEDGITDVKVKKPTLQECEELSKRIFLQSKNVDGFITAITSVSSETTSITNPLKLAKFTSAVKYSKNASSILGEETAFQTKAIKNIIQTLKSSGNL